MLLLMLVVIIFGHVASPTPLFTVGHHWQEIAYICTVVKDDDRDPLASTHEHNISQ